MPLMRDSCSGLLQCFFQTRHKRRSGKCYIFHNVNNVQPAPTVTQFFTFLSQNARSYSFRQDRQCTYREILRRVGVTNVAAEKQWILHILTVCL